MGDDAGLGGQGLRMAIANSLARIRTDAELTQGALAGILGIDQTTISRLEKGTSRAYVDQVLAIEQVCGVPPGTVLRLAGVLNDAPGVEAAVSSDPGLTGAQREGLLVLYRGYLGRRQ